ncbi:hypothetical protein FDC27_15800 [Clostridium botulinum]|nr:hypothetical protein [Clostridium botulinum]NFL59907.1 hypothetical protein [Clostridium botulinum]NFL63331.1 hypothetical protein [Clostridium botulinum]NFO68375.1 hypothetical protein [Clostridium botulinum]
MKKNNNIKPIIIILLMFSITLAILSTFVNLVVLNKNIYLELLDKSNAYTKVEEKLYEKMDSLLGSNVDENIKKSIITDEDIKKECNVVLTSIIDDLKTGKNNKPIIDNEAYKTRVKETLKSIIGQDVPSNNNLSFNNNFNIKNMSFIKDEVQGNKYEMSYTFDSDNNSISSSIVLVNLASRAELEAKGRAVLKAKGLTEAQARQKLAEKGISEEQVWNMLKENGYLDEEDSSDSNNNSNSSQNSETNSDDIKSSNNNNNDSVKEQLIKNNNLYSGEFKGVIDSVISDNTMTFEEKIGAISDKVSDKAGKFIDDEMQKLTLSNLIDSKLFKVSSNITSFLHKTNLIFVLISVVLIGILVKLNEGNIKLTFKNIGQVLIVVGILFILLLSGIYLFISNKGINIGPEYFKEPIVYVVNKFLTIFLDVSLVTFIIGILTFTFNKKNLKNR